MPRFYALLHLKPNIYLLLYCILSLHLNDYQTYIHIYHVKNLRNVQTNDKSASANIFTSTGRCRQFCSRGAYHRIQLFFLKNCIDLPCADTVLVELQTLI